MGRVGQSVCECVFVWAKKGFLFFDKNGLIVPETLAN